MSKKPIELTNENPLSVLDQQEELEKLSLKRQQNLTTSADDSHSYFETMSLNSCRTVGTTIAAPFSQEKSQALLQHKQFYTPDYCNEPTPPYTATVHEPSYFEMPLKDLGYETRRRLGDFLDPEIPTILNWRSLADELGFTYWEVSNLFVYTFSNKIEQSRTKFVI